MCVGMAAVATTSTTKDQSTALHWAASGGHASCVRAVLDAGANVEARDFVNEAKIYKAGASAKGEAHTKVQKKETHPSTEEETRPSTRTFFSCPTFSCSSLGFQVSVCFRLMDYPHVLALFNSFHTRFISAFERPFTML